MKRPASMAMVLIAACVMKGNLAVGATASTTVHGDIDLTGYTLTFSDEFDHLSATTQSPKGNATWYYAPPYGPAGNYSASRWDIGALGVANGVLSIKVFKDTAGNWRSGNISSIDGNGKGFSQLYGYFEVRARMPRSGTGSWPAFWLVSSTNLNFGSQNTSEIDIFEWYGNTYTDSKAVIQQASHNWPAGGAQTTGKQLYSPFTRMPNDAKPWEDFHIYGCQIDPEHITWYIDGVKTNQIPTSGSAGYMTGPYYMMIDYALGGGWPLSKVEDGSTFVVDWVRVYALPPTRSAGK
ncbi:glycoside hydrolase family 16 protein [Paraburkholderia phymatum]|uniref:Glycoside hydrolase family 16 protein n=1 Tax=Paraburkholderia phymatum TaxID=148447 RepID=A0ACC6U5W0_9BURK